MTAAAPEVRTYVTEVWCPPADNGVHALHSHMPEPEPLPEPEAEAEREPAAAEPEAERLVDTAADLGHDRAEYQARGAEPELEAEL